jgi:hypothetical protein
MISFKAKSVQYRAGQVQFQDRLFRRWHSFGLSQYQRFWCKLMVEAKRDVCFALSSRKHCVPHGRRSGVFEVQVRKAKLRIANAMRQLDAGNDDRRILETFEA